jgi:hypothetical protein
LDGMASATAFCDDSPSAYMFNDLSGMRQFSFFAFSYHHSFLPLVELCGYVGGPGGPFFLCAYFIWPCPTRWVSIVPVGGLVGVIRPRRVVGGFGGLGGQHIPHFLLCTVESFFFSFPQPFFVFTGSETTKKRIGMAWHSMSARLGNYLTYYGGN